MLLATRKFDPFKHELSGPERFKLFTQERPEIVDALGSLHPENRRINPDCAQAALCIAEYLSKHRGEPFVLVETSAPQGCPPTILNFACGITHPDNSRVFGNASGILLDTTNDQLSRVDGFHTTNNGYTSIDRKKGEGVPLEFYPAIAAGILPDDQFYVRQQHIVAGNDIVRWIRGEFDDSGFAVYDALSKAFFTVPGNERIGSFFDDPEYVDLATERLAKLEVLERLHSARKRYLSNMEREILARDTADNDALRRLGEELMKHNISMPFADNSYGESITEQFDTFRQPNPSASIESRVRAINYELKHLKGLLEAIKSCRAQKSID